MGDEGPVLISDVLPELAASLQVARSGQEKLLVANRQHVLLENNLTRKGVWSVEASRDERQLEIAFETEDVVGKLMMESSLGRLSTTEMEMVSWILGQWELQENPDDPWVHCSLKRLSDAFGVRWSGRQAAFIKRALERLHAVRFKAEVWNHKQQQLRTELFGIFDRVTIVERKDGHSGCWTVDGDNAPVKIKLGDFLHQQLKLGQFHRYAWHILRGKLRTPLAKRLYVFLDAQRGTPAGDGWVYEVGITPEFFSSLGMRDRNVSRARQRLRGACEEVLAADQAYTELHLREGGVGRWVLRRVKRWGSEKRRASSLGVAGTEGGGTARSKAYSRL